MFDVIRDDVINLEPLFKLWMEKICFSDLENGDLSINSQLKKFNFSIRYYVDSYFLDGTTNTILSIIFKKGNMHIDISIPLKIPRNKEDFKINNSEEILSNIVLYVGADALKLCLEEDLVSWT